MVKTNRQSIHVVFLTTFLLLISSCTEKKTTVIKETEERHVINLIDSTHIIRSVICQNKLSELLEEHDPEQLSLLLDNISPAKMAFETEVLSTTVPLVVVYYFKDTPDEQKFIEQLNDLASQYEDQVKFVIVDVERLFILAQDAEIEKYPTVLFVKEREIVDRIDKEITIDLLKQKLSSYQK